MKFCKRCGINKSDDAFNRNVSRSDELQDYCRECCCKLKKEYRTKNKDIIRHRKSEQAKKNPNSNRRRNKRFKENNPNKIKTSKHAQIARLPDYYIRGLIKQQFGTNATREIMQEKKLQIKLKRLIYEKQRQIRELNP